MLFITDCNRIFDTGKKNSLCPDEKEKDCMSVSLVAFLHLLTKSSGICVLRASGRALEHNVPALGSGRSSVLLTSLLEVESPGRSRAARLPLLVQLETKVTCTGLLQERRSSVMQLLEFKKNNERLAAFLYLLCIMATFFFFFPFSTWMCGRPGI